MFYLTHDVNVHYFMFAIVIIIIDITYIIDIIDIDQIVHVQKDMCSKFFGYKQTHGNNKGRLKMWLIYRLGVLDKFY